MTKSRTVFRDRNTSGTPRSKRACQGDLFFPRTPYYRLTLDPLLLYLRSPTSTSVKTRVESKTDVPIVEVLSDPYSGLVLG